MQGKLLFLNYSVPIMIYDYIIHDCVKTIKTNFSLCCISIVLIYLISQEKSYFRIRLHFSILISYWKYINTLKIGWSKIIEFKAKYRSTCIKVLILYNTNVYLDYLPGYKLIRTLNFTTNNFLPCLKMWFIL